MSYRPEVRQTRPWVVVADHRHARIYEFEQPNGALVEVQHLEQLDARRRKGELVSDRPGRAFSSVGVRRHGLEPPVDPKEQENIRFAKQVADQLEAGRVEGRFDSLILVADPQVLGLLRQKLTPACRELIREEISKNLGRFNAREVRSHLPEQLWPPVQ